MDMKDTLHGHWPYINADVLDICTELLVQQLAFLTYQLHTGVDLPGRQVEIAGNVAFRNHHRMARACRVGIPSAVCKVVNQGDALWVCTEQAGIIEVSVFPLFFFGCHS
jgi:hypothetical protein